MRRILDDRGPAQGKREGQEDGNVDPYTQNRSSEWGRRRDEGDHQDQGRKSPNLPSEELSKSNRFFRHEDLPPCEKDAQDESQEKQSACDVRSVLAWDPADQCPDEQRSPEEASQ